MTEWTYPAILLPVRHRSVPAAIILVLVVVLTSGCSADGSPLLSTTTSVPMPATPPVSGQTPTPSQQDAALRSVEPYAPSVSLPVPLPTGYRIEALLDGLDNPTSIAATPDGRLLITEQQAGRVRVVQDGQLQEEPWFQLPIYLAPDQFVQELGLVTIAVDPLFNENGFVYIYYTIDDGGGPRTVLSRLRDVDGRGAELTELVQIDAKPDRIHIAGAIAFRPDGTILVGVGDHEQLDRPPRLDTLAGKILRIDRDGQAPPDNPFAGRDDADPRVFAYGLRNPYGVAVDPDTGEAYIAENRLVAGDAIYRLEAGADYGWPEHLTVFREPLLIYERPAGPAGIIVYTGDVLPAFTGDLFFCTFHGGGAVHWSEPEDTAALGERDRIVALGCTTGLTEGADGFLYFLSYVEGRLLRISR